MRKLIWSLLLASPVALIGSAALANETSPLQLNTQENNLIAQSVQEQDDVINQIDKYSREGNKTDSIGQVTNVSELKDVSPGDWAYEALRSLVERYGCIAGYPNGTFRGNRPMTRYEFAAGLNSCLNQIERLISESQATTQEDIDKLSRLVQEFQSELAALGTRVDNIEGRVAFLEDHQFSTTTKLNGEVTFGISDIFSNDDTTPSGDGNTVFQYRARLDLVSSFTGKDALHTRLTASNAFLGDQTGNLDQGAATFQTGNTNNSVNVDWLAYYFPVGDKGQVYLAATGALWQDFVPTVSPYLDSYTGATGSISSFAESSPIYKILGGDAGLGINYNFTDKVSFSAGYFGGNANNPANGASNPTDGAGIFNGNFSALAQLTFTPTENIQIAATYVRSFIQQGNPIFNLGVGTVDNGGGNIGVNNGLTLGNDVNVDSFGAEASLKISDKIVANGYFGYSKVNDSTNGSNDSADVFYYALGLAFPDLGKEGNLGGIIVGAEPYVSSATVAGVDLVSDDTPLHIEAFYKYQINDNISITPGVIYLTAPQGESDNDDAIIGVLRTTFTF
jgi:Carbohydrate-selective porin, OprB family/S-layer homology domain